LTYVVLLVGTPSLVDGGDIEKDVLDIGRVDTFR
jgi:hypothetical protein